jgi:asparagine synthase (glutamine-hydrolysing)
MCGLVGFYSNNQFDKNIIKEMGDSISHRGPDDSGYWIDDLNQFNLCHRRLSILDLSHNGAQPMISNSSRWIIAFNGEIYNYKLIKELLIKDFGSINFKGTSDTEIILFAFENWGIEKTIALLNGMFAIVLWDNQNKKIYLIRDRVGEKPLYYGIINDVFYFGSELKSFSKHPSFEKRINIKAAHSFFQYNYVPNSLCIYENIYKVLPGTFIEFDTTKFLFNSIIYWNIKDKLDDKIQPSKYKSDIYFVNKLQNLLREKISQQLVSDVPVGAFLSGGVDSSTIVSIMQEVSDTNIKTFSIGFQNKKYNEAIYANEIAKHIRTDHTELYLSDKDAINIIPLLSNIYDEPFADSSQIPTFLVSKLAKEQVTVCLSGDGGDELFSGYNRYSITNQFWSYLKLIPESSRRYIGKKLQDISTESWDYTFSKFNPILPQNLKLSNFGEKIHKIASFLDSKDEYDLYNRFISNPMPLNLLNLNKNVFSYDFQKLENLNFIEKMMISDFEMYLPDDILVKVDRASMANSLETRVPFLDHNIIEFAWKIPFNLKIRNGEGKWIIKQILNKYVPEKLYVRPKMGFGIPIGELLNGPLQNWANELLTPHQLSKHNILNVETVLKIWDEHKIKKKNWQYALWSILMFQSWYENNFSK